MYSVLIQSLLEHCINQCKDKISTNTHTSEYSDYEDILLFHAAFSNFFNDELKRKVTDFASELTLKLDKYSDSWDPFDKYSSIIMLNYLLDSKIAIMNEYWFSKIIDMTYTHQQTNRIYAAKVLVYFLTKYLQPDIKLLDDDSIKEKLIMSAQINLDKKHFTNDFIFALISFLNLSLDDKKELYKGLHDYCIKVDNPNDKDLLKKYYTFDPYITNPFSRYISKCMQLTLENIDNAGYVYPVRKDFLQFDLWGQPESKYYYYFHDNRLSEFIKFEEKRV